MTTVRERGQSFHFASTLRVVLIHESVTELVQARNEKASKALALRRLNQKLKRISRKVLLAQEEERRAISRDIHDTFSQRIACLRLMLADVLDKTDVELQNLVKVLDTEIGKLADDIRVISHRLHPSILRDQGLLGAIQQEIDLAKTDSHIDIELSACNIPTNLPPDVSTCIYRILQEALTNATKHSAARKLRVSIEFDKHSLILKVIDNGCGFSQACSEASGIGLSNMRERAELMEGRLELKSVPGQGTSIEVCIPWAPSRKGQVKCGP
jgi:signal transduction histidine kinase